MPSTVLDIYRNDKVSFEEKTVQQVVSFCADGKLTDGSNTSIEFRDFLKNISSSLLAKYASNCLSASFENSGLILQDIINEIGARLDFSVENGLYRGRSNQIGFDGIWLTKENYGIIVEVKTTDTYRINLDTIAKYRTTLIQQNKIFQDSSSILIVVGRQDTGDLEAQIRGSKHAWDIRLISTDALLKLLSIKESLTDLRTAVQINELLKPTEYTRLDRIVDIMFLASEDIQLETKTEIELSESREEDFEDDDSDAVPISESYKRQRATPSNYHEACAEIIANYLDITLIRKGQSLFSNPDDKYRVVCAVSKRHERPNRIGYWYAFHPSQQEYLEDSEKSFVAYACGTPEKILLIPFETFLPLVQNMNTSKKDRGYWHVKIHEIENVFYLKQPLAEMKKIDITRFLLPPR